LSDKTLTRADLVESVVKTVGLPRHEAAELVETVLQELSSALARGEPVKLSSFGSFGIREKRQRIGRNPKTGEEVPITPRRVLVFRASNIMKKRIDETIKADTGKSNGKAKGKVATSTRAKKATKAKTPAAAKSKVAAKPKKASTSTAKKNASVAKGKKSTAKKSTGKKTAGKKMPVKKAGKGSRK